MTSDKFWQSIAALVSRSSVVVDRPKGSAHPRMSTVIYPLDYGYLDGTSAGDRDGIDVWIGSLKARKVTGIVCTVDGGKRDAEIKVLIGCSRAERRQVLAFHNGHTQAAILVEAPRR